MEFREVIDRRRTVRDFSDRSVPAGIVDEAIGAAFKAPSYNHLREWHFVIVDDPALKRSLTETEEMSESVSEETKAALLAAYEKTASDMYLEAIPKQRRMILDAPLVIAAAYLPKTPVERAARVYDLNCLASVWCGIENLLLALAERDIFGVTFIPKNTGRVKSALGVPEEYEIAALIPVGYRSPNATDVKQKEIRAEERIHRNGW